MRELTRRELVQRGAVVSGAAAAALSPWAASLARAAGEAPGLNARRRATCTALAEVVADHPAAASNFGAAVDSFVARYEHAPSGYRTTMLNALDAIEASTAHGTFSAASKKERAGALRRSTDELCSGPLRPGSKAMLVDAGLAGVARHMVCDYGSSTPKPIPEY
jgi:hypothetical protein